MYAGMEQLQKENFIVKVKSFPFLLLSRYAAHYFDDVRSEREMETGIFQKCSTKFLRLEPAGI